MRFILQRPGKVDPLTLIYQDGTQLFFSYEQPVGAYVPGRGFIVLPEAEMSITTRARVNKWLGDADYVEVPYAEILRVFTDRPAYRPEADLTEQ